MLKNCRMFVSDIESETFKAIAEKTFVNGWKSIGKQKNVFCKITGNQTECHIVEYPYEVPPRVKWDHGWGMEPE